MKKRIVAFILALASLFTLLTGCNSVSKDDAYMSKGEFFQLFVDEMSLYATDYNDEIKIDKSDQFYDAVQAIIEWELFDKDEAVKNLDKAVTKEIVAVVCANHLYFRKTFENNLKDSNKLIDPQAAADAVGHGIVKDENGYFNAPKKMTYFDCQEAIDITKDIDANGTFEEDESEIEVQYKENVADLTDIDPKDISVLDPSAPDYDQYISGINIAPVSNLNDNKIPIMNLSTTSQHVAPTNMNESLDIVPMNQTPLTCSNAEDANEGDIVVVKVISSAISVRNLKVGDLFVFGISGGFELSYQHRNIGCGEILSIRNDYLHTYYTCRVPNAEELAASAKLNKTTKGIGAASGWDKKGTDPLPKGLTIPESAFKLNNDGISFEVKWKVSNNPGSWRDAEHAVDLTYKVSVNDVKLTVDGFGSVLTGNIKDAICKLDYSVTNELTAESNMRYTPDNNRNGKFPSNLSRSRWTDAGAKGAKSIKIARIPFPLGGGFQVEMYICLTIQVDGTIKVTLTQTYGRGIRIQNNKVIPINEKETEFDIKANVNAEVAVGFNFSLNWSFTKNWIDVALFVGIGVDCNSKVFVLDEKHTKCTDIKTGYVTDKELEAIKTTFDIDFCFNIQPYYFARISGVNKESKIGKIVRWFDKGFDLSKEWRTNIGDGWHFEDGGKVSSCTRKYSEMPDSNNDVKDNDADTFVIDTYKIIAPTNMCSLIKITGMPATIIKISDNMGGINVYVKDPSIASATYMANLNSIMIDPKKVGVTEVVIETKNKRFKLECSLDVVENDLND